MMDVYERKTGKLIAVGISALSFGLSQFGNKRAAGNLFNTRPSENLTMRKHYKGLYVVPTSLDLSRAL
jgi:hypothetical protein